MTFKHEQAIKASSSVLAKHDIAVTTDFPVDLIGEREIWARDNRRMPYDLLMLIPPFAGPDEVAYRGLTDETGFVRVDRQMRVRGARNVYAAGDCVSLIGPKMGHLAVLQGEVAAANLVAELSGREPEARYEHELTLIINEEAEDSLFLHKELWTGHLATIRQGRFWSWAKQVHTNYWARAHKLSPIEKANQTTATE